MICPQSNPIMKNTKELERLEIIAVVDTLRVGLVSDIKKSGAFTDTCANPRYEKNFYIRFWEYINLH